MGRNAAVSESGGDLLERLWRSRPDQREALQPHVQRAKAYRNECGCALSGAFLLGALGLLLANGIWIHAPIGGGLIAQSFGAVAFVFAAGMIGKLTGVGIARARLALLYRGLRIRYSLEGV